MSSTEHVAIYGGSFDPPHIGHTATILHVLSHTNVDTVWVMPSYSHALKNPQASFEQRFAMVTRATNVFGDRVKVSDVEMRLSLQHTVDVVEWHLDAYPERKFSLVVGSDILHEADKWKDFDRLAEMIPFILMLRQGYPIKIGSLARFKTPPIFLRAGCVQSSTNIRRLMAYGAAPPATELHKDVIDFILKERLYLYDGREERE